jgi:serine/threonine protein phosphatase PrpC
MSDAHPHAEDVTAPDAPAGAVAHCPSCATPVVPGDAFCEACGAELAGAAGNDGEPTHPGPDVAGDPHEPPRTTVRFAVPMGPPTACRACGGAIDADGFCSQCGTRALTERDHWSEHPSSWVAGVCDRGVIHAANEDAMALAATTASDGDEASAVLVVCDGVTSAPESARASLAAVRVACRSLVDAGLATGSPAGRTASGSFAAQVERWHAALVEAATLGQAEAVAVARALGDPPEPPSCTFVAAVVTADLVSVAWCGDSRAYWLPDAGSGVQLTTDHSIGTELIRNGASREAAEADPTCHVITRWLGADSVDPRPEVVTHRLDEAGWVLVCSDGMWNYASTPETLRALLDEAVVAGADDPLAIAAAMVARANALGGHDNVTVALARHGLPTTGPADDPPPLP